MNKTDKVLVLDEKVKEKLKLMKDFFSYEYDMNHTYNDTIMRMMQYFCKKNDVDNVL